jgi:hypothetical protein
VVWDFGLGFGEDTSALWEQEQRELEAQRQRDAEAVRSMAGAALGGAAGVSQPPDPMAGAGVGLAAGGYAPEPSAGPAIGAAAAIQPAVPYQPTYEQQVVQSGPWIDPSFWGADISQTGNVYDYARDAGIQQQANQAAVEAIPATYSGPDLREMALNQDIYRPAEAARPDFFGDLYTDITRPANVAIQAVREPLLDVVEQASRFIPQTQALNVAGDALPVLPSTRQLADVAIPRNIEELALEGTPLGFAGDIRRGFAAADPIAARAAQEVAPAVTGGLDDLVTFYHGSSGPLSGTPRAGMNLAPTREMAETFAATNARMEGGVPTITEIQVPRSATRGLDPNSLTGSMGAVELVDPAGARIIDPRATARADQSLANWQQPGILDRVRQGVTGGERGAMLNPFGKPLKPSTTGHVTLPDGTFEPATRDVVRNGVERVFSRKSDPVVNKITEILEGIGDSADFNQVTDEIVDAVVNAKTLGGTALFRGVDRSMVRDALAEIGDDLEIVMSAAGKPQVRLSTTRSNALGKAITEAEQDALAVEARVAEGPYAPKPGETVPPPEEVVGPVGQRQLTLGQPAPGPVARGADDPTALLKERARTDVGKSVTGGGQPPKRPPSGEVQSSAQFWKPSDGPLWEKSAKFIGGLALAGPRLLQTGVADLSYLLRQAAQAIRHKGYWTNIAPALKSTFREDYALRRMRQIEQAPYNPRTLELTEFREKVAGQVVPYTKREEDFFSSVVRKIPVLGPIFRGTERFATVFINGVRSDMVNNLGRTMARHGTDVGSPEFLDTLERYGSYVSRVTGRGNIGQGQNVLLGLNQVFYSLRRNVGMVQAPFYMFNSNATVRKEAMLDFITFMGVGSGTLALADLAGAEVGLDPTSADFGKIRVGDTRVDVWAGYQQMARLTYKIANGQIEHPGQLTDKDRDTLINFLRTKLAPTAGAIWDAAAGENIVGQKFGDAQYWRNFLVPLAWQGMVEGLEEDGLKGAGLGTLGILGVGVQSYPANQTERLTEYLNSGAVVLTDPTSGKVIKDGAQLDSAMRNELRQSQPDLFNEPTKEAEQRQKDMQTAFQNYQKSGDIGEYFGEMANIRNNYKAEFDYEPEGEWNKKVAGYFDEQDKLLNPTAKRENEEKFLATLNPAEQEAFSNILTSSIDPQHKMIKEANDYLRDTIDPVYDGFYQEARSRFPQLTQYETYFEALDAGGAPSEIAGRSVGPKVRAYFTQNPGNDALNYIMGNSDKVYTSAAAQEVRQWAEKNGVSIRPPMNPGGVPWY